jgi:hypothetical protein
MSVNLENKNLYEEYKKFHINDGGKNPDGYAMSELIKQSIEKRNYLIYYGGGYEYKSENRINKYDVVVTFNWGGDPTFMICMDNSDGDACELWNSDDKGWFSKKLM